MFAADTFSIKYDFKYDFQNPCHALLALWLTHHSAILSIMTAPIFQTPPYVSGTSKELK